MTSARGLPAQPEAYRDGGLAVAATAGSMHEAEIMASILRGADVPAWLDAPHVGVLYGISNPGLFPAGIRVLVPLGRLRDAQAVLAEHKAERKKEPEAARWPEPPSTDETALEIPPTARWIAMLLLAGVVGAPAPYVLVRSLWWLAKVGRHWKRDDAPAELKTAARWAVAAAIVAVPASVFLVWLAVKIVRAVLLPP